VADEIDITNDQHQFLLDQKINEIRKGIGASLPKTGRCNFCREPVQIDQVFCDSECASDFEQLNRFKR
jgi:hypothetical protein